MAIRRSRQVFAYSLSVISDIAGLPIEQSEGISAMEYKQFVVRAFEREPGKWRASVERANGIHNADSGSPSKTR